MMRQVFLIGDSIRLGYRKYVSERLKDIAQVFSSDDNARFTAYTLRYVSEWAALCAQPQNIAVVHFNNGLWDACRWNGDSEALTPLPVYLHNLERLVNAFMKLFPNAKLIFATSTPVASLHPRISNEELDEMNEQAVRLLSAKGVLINDLNALVKAHPEFICDDLTHMTQAGYEALGAAVALKIRAAL